MIESDDEKTWPQPILEKLTDIECGIRQYQIARAQIDREAEEDVLRSICRPENPYQQFWDQALEEIQIAIIELNLVGYHAARLTGHECGDICENGLRLLSRALIESRLDHLEETDELCSETVRQLKENNQAEEYGRSGMSWFVFSREPLSEEGGMKRLFRTWGGEALYWGHERSYIIGPMLRSIGKPRIVIASVPAERIQCYTSIGERLLRVWCARRNIKTDHDPNFEGYIRVDTPANDIIKIISCGDTEFQELTGCSSWDEPIV